MEINFHEVRFDLYCKKCKYSDLDSDKEPCNECLTNPFAENSRKPINFEEDRRKVEKR